MAKILFFGRLGDVHGREVEVALPAAGCTVGELRDHLSRTLPFADETLRDRCVTVCLDQAVAWDDAMVRPDQEIAILPPLSGG